MGIPSEIQHMITELYGKNCCRQCVGRGRSLSIGFGQKILRRRTAVAEYYYGEWEIGTYSSAWRIVSGDRILLGSRNTVDAIKELDSKLQEITIGKVVDIVTPSIFDVAVRLDSNVTVEFMCASSEEEEMFHVFCPNSVFMEYSVLKGWRSGPSDAPWE